MTDREYYEKRIKPLMQSFDQSRSEIVAWERLSDIDKAQVSEIRREEQRVL